MQVELGLCLLQHQLLRERTLLEHDLGQDLTDTLIATIHTCIQWGVVVRIVVVVVVKKSKKTTTW